MCKQGKQPSWNDMWLYSILAGLPKLTIKWRACLRCTRHLDCLQLVQSHPQVNNSWNNAKSTFFLINVFNTKLSS
jgi:hypothetical protein